MFFPNRILIEKNAADHKRTQEILAGFSEKKEIEIIYLNSNQWKKNIPGTDLHDWYRESKKTLVIGVKKGLIFQSCKPSAHYQLPLVSGCMGQCEYCYLNTMLGDRPFVKINVNTEEILARADKYSKERLPDITIFEGAATSDPVPVEPYSHSLEQAIRHFGQNEKTRFRFVTKYNDVDSLLELEHNGHTEIRFSINTDNVISQYEHGTASCKKRMEAGSKVAKAGYPMGYLIAPVFLSPKWKEEYHEMMLQLAGSLPGSLQHPVTFEVISHRYTTQAKNRINQVFPDNKLPMDEQERTFKYGQFGYGKYIYPKEKLQEIKVFFSEEIKELFPSGEIKYII